MNKDELINSLVCISEIAPAFFHRLGLPNLILCDLEYAHPAIPLDSPNYQGQNQGLPDHIFGAIYRTDAPLLLYRPLAFLVLEAACLVYHRHNWLLILKDGLRPIEAQQAMYATAIAQGWTDGYVSTPGKGGHPRGMAIDIAPVDARTGQNIDMGTLFDHFGAASNRDCPTLTPQQQENRSFLNRAMLEAADDMKTPLHLLESEWWDFRLPPDVIESTPALSDTDLPPAHRMMRRGGE